MKQETNIPENAPGWKGYDIDELRYMKAYTVARIEIEKERIATSSKSLYSGRVNSRAYSIAGKILGSLSYMDYGILGFKLFRRVRSIFNRKR